MRHRQDRQYGGIGLGAVIAMAVVAALIAGGVFVLLSVFGFRGAGIRHETSLSAQYLTNQSYLSKYTSGFYERFGIYQYQSDKVNTILEDYAKGRNFGADGQSSQAGFINAVVEAVPDLKMLDASRLLDYVESNRQGYHEHQEKLLDMLRAYGNWISGEDDPWRTFVLSYVLTFPSDRLEARIGTEVVRGEKALEQMKLIVTTSSTKEAYKSGTMEPLKVPSGEKK